MTIQATNRFLRQLDLVDQAIFKTPVTCIGAGGTGSFIVLTLAKMGFQDITVWDDDTIEEHNISNQFYPWKLVGNKKVSALRAGVHEMDGVMIKIEEKRWDRREELRGVVISAVDSMAVRREIFNATRRNPLVKWLIDPRLGGQQVEVYTVKTDERESREMYEKSLWSDGETSPLPCTAQAIMYTALTAAALVSNQVRLVLEGMAYHNCLLFDMNNVNVLQMQSR